MTKKTAKNTSRSRFMLFFNSKKGDYAIVTLAVALYVVLTSVALTASSIWFDEAFSAYIVRHNWWDIALYTAVDVHPPFYYWVLSAWTHLFGTSEVAFRSLSVLFGAVVVALSYILTNKLFGRRAAWLAVLLVAISPTLVRFGQEARMYTLLITIVFAATLLLLSAMKSNKRSTWIWYGVLVSIGMWTHYFAALAWLAHWTWRAIALRLEGKRGKKLFAAFFSKNWLIAHGVAIALFAPWAVAMVSQFLTNQQGFWIGPVSIETPMNYLASTFFYLEGWQVIGWFATWLFVLVAIIVTFGIATYRQLTSVQDRIRYWLLLSIVVVPPIILIILSMPPLKSAFVERYLMSSMVFLSVFTGVVIAAQIPKLKRWMQVGVIALFIGASAVGISKVYYYGNYNKNSHVSIQTRQLIEAIREQAKPGEPIIADSPWIYYEASFYDNSTNPIYFLESTTDNYKFGSLEMLKDDTKSKIVNLDDFLKQHPVVWYFGNTGSTEITPPKSEYNLVPLQRLKAVDPIDHKADYNAVQLRVSAE